MRNFTDSIVVKAVIVLFSVFCIATIIKLQFENNEIQSQIENCKVDLEEKVERDEALERELNEPVDEDYIKDKAKEKLDLRDPAEIIFYNGD